MRTVASPEHDQCVSLPPATLRTAKAECKDTQAHSHTCPPTGADPTAEHLTPGASLEGFRVWHHGIVCYVGAWCEGEGV